MNRLCVALASIIGTLAVLGIGFWLYGEFSGEEAAIIPEPPRLSLAQAGVIYVDSPEIYTRERLVNDRYQQDAWLRRRLEMSDSLNFGSQGVRDIRTASQVIIQARFSGTVDPLAATKPPPQAAPPAPPAAETSPSATAADSGSASPPPPSSNDRSPIDDFQDRMAYREEIRSAIIENQLDDRHDLDGNTLYRLKFDATIVPANRNPHWARIEVKVNPRILRLTVPNYSPTEPIEARARHLQELWVDRSPAEAQQWQQVFNKYLEGLSQARHSQLTTRVAALRKIIEGDETFSNATMQTRQDFRELRYRIDNVVKTAVEDLYNYYYSVDGISAEIKGRCQNAAGDQGNVIGVTSSVSPSSIGTSHINYVSCMIRGTVDRIDLQGPTGLVSRTQMLDRVLAGGLWQNFSGTSSGGRGNPASNQRKDNPQIETLSLPRSPQSLVRVDPYEYVEVLFDISTLGEDEARSLPGYDPENYSFRLCRGNHPEVFEKIDAGLAKYGLSSGDARLHGSPLFRFQSPYLEVDPQTGAMSCFESYLDLHRNDGFITFLEPFMGENGQPAHSYAVTPKEAVQRLTDSFDQAQASSALVAVSLAAAALDAGASAAALKELQSGFSGMTRFPLIVGYSQRDKLSDSSKEQSDLTFGWIVGPRFRPGQDGGPPQFHQVLTQQTLSALISVPAWWPSLDLEISSYWMDMESGEEHLGRQQQYLDVRLPGDFQEIQRILYPVLDKAPKIDRDNMEMAVIRTATGAEIAGAATGHMVPIIIPGQNLWRSTVVTLGALRAQEIWVMPNMEGIIAHFDRAAITQGPRPEFPFLRVWTSEGMDSIQNKVCIEPPGRVPTQACPTGAAPSEEADPDQAPAAPERGEPPGQQQVTAATQAIGAKPEATPDEPATPTGTSVSPAQDVEEPASDLESTVAQMERQANELVARLEVLQPETQRSEITRAFEAVSIQAVGAVGAAAIQQDGYVHLRLLRILGLAELVGQDLDLRVGLVPEALLEEVRSSHFAVPIDAWNSKITDGVLEVTAAKLPVLAPIANGEFVRVVLQVKDPESEYSRSIPSANLVFYTDEERASIRAVGPDIKLDPDGHKGTFTVTLPARTTFAFPNSESNWIVVKAHSEDSGEELDLQPTIFPLSDFDESDMATSDELTLTMALDLSGSDRKALESLLAQHGRIRIELAFNRDQPGEIPKIENNLFVVGLAKPRS